MRTMLHYDKIRYDSLTDGPGGPRTVVWFSGCIRAWLGTPCPGCQNPELWTHKHAASHLPDLVAGLLLDVGGDQPITITGGEPLDQGEALRQLLVHIRKRSPGTHIIVYTGYTWEELMRLKEVTPTLIPTLLMIDVLVDGEYVQEEDNDYLQWRGSANQRPINMRATIDNGGLTDYNCLVLEDWDTQEITISNGTATMTGGLAEELDMEGDKVPRCGQARER